ncbi:MAG: DUF507 domain-containing protein [Sulfurospirillum sp.]|nr:MAG: DUF507 domain-containing protein [Sulfurospirillum sp.]
MKIRLPHAPYIANKITVDLLNSGYTKFLKGVESVKKVSQEIIEEDLKKELALERRVEELLEENEDEMEFNRVDRRSMFWMIKKKIAKDYDVILSYEDRYNDLAHKILDRLWQEDLIEYSVAENVVKNVILGALESYINSFEDIEDIVVDKIRGMKRELIPGSDEYDVVFERLYKEELKRRGMFI